MVRPSAIERVCLRVGSWETARSAETEPSTVSGSPRNRASIIASTSDGGADLEVRRDLREVGVADDDVQPAVLLRVGVRLVAGVDDGPLEGGLQTDLDLEEVGPLADLEAVVATVLTQAHPTGAGDHLSADEEGREVPDDVGEGRRAPHQVVLVRTVRGALVVGVVLVEQDRRAVGQLARSPLGVEHDLLPRLVPADDVERCGHLRRGVLRVGVVDVQPRAVGEDDVGQAHVLVGQLARVGDLTGHVEAARVAQRGLLLEVPAGPAGSQGGRGVGVDDLRGGHHRVGRRLPDDRDAVLDLGAHHPADRHAAKPTRGHGTHRVRGIAPCWPPCRSSDPVRCRTCR